MLRHLAPLAVVLLANLPRADAATLTWDGGAGTGAWGTALNWSTNALPAATDGVLFAGATPTALALGGDRTVATATVSGGNYSLDGGTLTATSGLSLTGGSLQVGTGGTTGAISGPVALSAGTSMLFNRSDAVTMAATISGAGSVVQNGANTLRLTADQAFTGNLTINSGSASIGAGSTVQTFAATQIVNHGNLIFNTPNDLTYAGAISGAGTLFKVNANTTTLSGAHGFTGPTQLEGGTLRITGTLGGGTHAGSFVTSNGTTLAFASSTNQTLSGVLSGAGAITQSGTAKLILTGNNTATGTLTISNGSVSIGDGGTSGAFAGNIVTDTDLAFNRSDDFTYAGVLSGGANGSVANSGAGRLTLSSSGHDYDGILYVFGGGAALTGSGASTFETIYLGSDSSLSLSAGVLNAPNFATGNFGGHATVTLSGGATFNTTSADLATSAGATTAVALSGNGTAWNNAGTLEADRVATLSIGAGATVTTGSLGGSNLTTTLAGGTLAVTANATINGTLVADAEGGTLDTGVATVTLSGALSGSGSFTKTGAGTLTVSGNYAHTGALAVDAGTLGFARSTPTTIATAISGAGGLRAGSSTLTLTRNNTYTGATTVDGPATLILGDSGAGGSIAGDLTVNGGAFIRRAVDWTYSGALSGGGELHHQGPGAFTLATAATTSLTVHANSSGGFIVQQALVTGGITIGNYYFGENGSMTVTGASASVVNSGFTIVGNGISPSLQRTGTLTITNNATFVSAQSVSIGETFAPQSTVTVSAGGRLSAPNVIGAGTLILDDGTLAYTGNANHSLAHTTVGSGGGTLDTGSHTVTFSGDIDGTGALTKTGSGTLAFSGTSSAPLRLAAGTLAPGNGIGSASFSTLVLEAGSTTTFQLAGAASYDQITLSALASLGGTLAVTLEGGYVPAAGTTFQLFSGGTLGGSFAAFDLPSTVAWDTSQLTTHGTITAVPEPHAAPLAIVALLLLIAALRRRARE